LTAFFGFQWHITDRCNLRCAHCYQESFDSSSERPLEELLAMAEAIFSSLPDRSVSINLTGGEPLLYPGLGSIIGKLESYPNLKELNVITNATVVTEQVLGMLLSMKKPCVVKVSVESADEAVNDRVRGEGNLALVSKNIGIMIEAGLRTVVMMTLGMHNVRTIGQTVGWARSAGVDGVIFERFVPMGKGWKMSGEVLTREGWNEAVRGIIGAAGIDTEPRDLAAFKAFWIDLKKMTLEGALCNLGEEAMALMPDGAVFPCRRLPIPAGNILKARFSEILSRLRGYRASNIRRRLKGDICGGCDVEECAGCRAMAYALTGDLLADDPLCTL
jgi:radical SAM protein with 4Fe4S-binding SPASM domain